MRTWKEARADIYTTEEIIESDLRVAIIGELITARNEKNISQRELERLSGVKQPVISRMETGENIPQLDTVLKVLGALGKTLYVGDITPSLLVCEPMNENYSVLQEQK
ncbi:MAG: helix-turn-helix transcriptional regulator [Lachnospiraceae bacterium]|jgi:transcriptional regulator with XRE-family HTH domain|nr:helix-turn-helix transcriptional regulator [Lachnospiraceae bacterium]